MIRTIKSTSNARSVQLADCLQTIFALELLAPSQIIYLHYGWISDVVILGNSYGQYRALLPELDTREVLLSHVLNALAERKRDVRIITQPNELSNESFLRKLGSRVLIKLVSGFHEKSLVTDHFVLKGSMNLTYSGLTKRAEDVTLYTDQEIINHEQLEASQRWLS